MSKVGCGRWILIEETGWVCGRIKGCSRLEAEAFAGQMPGRVRAHPYWITSYSQRQEAKFFDWLDPVRCLQAGMTYPPDLVLRYGRAGKYRKLAESSLTAGGAQ